jgi:hypothetical protein
MGYPPDMKWAYVKPQYRYFECYMDGKPVVDQHGQKMRVVSYEHVGGQVKLGIRPQARPDHEADGD